MPVLASALLALALPGCGAQAASPRGGSTSQTGSTPSATGVSTVATPDGKRELVGIGTVLATAGGPAMLCLGPVAMSLPPQCTGPTIVGWDWARAPQAESKIGVRWGSYAVVGRWDGTAFTLTRPPTTPEAFTGEVRPPAGTPDFTTPCPAPAGGWRVVDPAKATQQAFDTTATAAESLPGFAGLWIDQPHPMSETEANDPTQFILDVKVKGDVAAAEATLRRTWGGKLCVSEAKRTDAELRRIQDAVTHSPGTMSASSDMIAERIDLSVLFDDGTLQRAMDARYGAGLVRVTSALYPYETR